MKFLVLLISFFCSTYSNSYSRPITRLKTEVLFTSFWAGVGLGASIENLISESKLYKNNIISYNYRQISYSYYSGSMVEHQSLLIGKSFYDSIDPEDDAVTFGSIHTGPSLINFLDKYYYGMSFEFHVGGILDDFIGTQFRLIADFNTFQNMYGVAGCIFLDL